jgi:hypothetical protein
MASAKRKNAPTYVLEMNEREAALLRSIYANLSNGAVIPEVMSVFKALSDADVKRVRFSSFADGSGWVLNPKGVKDALSDVHDGD